MSGGMTTEIGQVEGGKFDERLEEPGEILGRP